MSARMAKVVNGGKIVLPAALRRQVGIDAGDTVVVEAVGAGELRIRTISASVKRAQSLIAQSGSAGRSLVDELIAERRKSARDE